MKPKSIYTHPKRKSRMKRPEQNLQIGIMNYVRKIMQIENCSRFIAAHVPNGGHRTKSEAGIFKAMGVMAGFADIIVLVHPNEVHATPTAFFVEMKAKGGDMEESQIYFEDRVTFMGFKYYLLEAEDQRDALDQFMAIMKENGVDISGTKVCI